MDLSLYHRLIINKDGQRENSADRIADERSLSNALTRIPATIDKPLTDVPAAWLKGGIPRARRGRHADYESWGDSAPAFEPRFAAKIFKHFRSRYGANPLTIES